MLFQMHICLFKCLFGVELLSWGDGDGGKYKVKYYFISFPNKTEEETQNVLDQNKIALFIFIGFEYVTLHFKVIGACLGLGMLLTALFGDTVINVHGVNTAGCGASSPPGGAVDAAAT